MYVTARDNFSPASHNVIKIPKYIIILEIQSDMGTLHTFPRIWPAKNQMKRETAQNV